MQFGSRCQNSCLSSSCPICTCFHCCSKAGLRKARLVFFPSHSKMVLLLKAVGVSRERSRGRAGPSVQGGRKQRSQGWQKTEYIPAGEGSAAKREKGPGSQVHNPRSGEPTYGKSELDELCGVANIWGEPRFCRSHRSRFSWVERLVPSLAFLHPAIGRVRRGLPYSP